MQLHRLRGELHRAIVIDSVHWCRQKSCSVVVSFLSPLTYFLPVVYFFLMMQIIPSAKHSPHTALPLLLLLLLTVDHPRHWPLHPTRLP